MGNAKHTPGPWVFEYRKGDHPLNDQDGWGCEGLWAVNGGLIFGSGQNWDGTYSPPNDADAALIAAAPELLAACEAALPVFDASYNGDTLNEDIQNIRAIAEQLRRAIAKAKDE